MKKKSLADEKAIDKIVCDERSIYLRELIINTMVRAGRGHLASALSIIEILRVLYDDILNVSPETMQSSARDRFILSKGHGCLALYAVLADKGFFPKSELETFCGPGSRLAGHPEFPRIPGVEASTGSLGHGPSIGIGIALSAIQTKRSFRVFVLVGDGELGEGSIWEAALCASKHQLSNLILIIDYNKFQSYGSTEEVSGLEPLAQKWLSFGWQVKEVDGHNIPDLRQTLGESAANLKKPTVIICHTVKGAGIDIVEANLAWHHKSRFTEEDAKELYRGIRRN